MHQNIMYQDTELLERIRGGDAPAFRALVKRYHPGLLAAATAIAGRAMAEDCVQEAWLSVLKHIDRFEQRASLKTWLYTIAANAAKQKLGSRQRDDQLFDRASPHGMIDADRFDDNGHWRTPPALWNHDSPDALLSAEALQDCIDTTLEQLPEAQQAIMQLREHDELSLEDICNILAISHSNARVLLHRARMKVFATIEHFEVTGEC